MAKRPPDTTSGTSATLLGIAAEEIESAVAEINRLHHRTRFDAAVAVGRFLLVRWFGGSRQRFKLNQRKEASFRALAKHPQLAASPSYLNTAVRILDHVDVFPPDVLARIPLSWHRAVLPIAGVGERLAIIEAVIASGGSYADLSQRVRDHQVVGTRKPGRPRAPPERLLARQIRALLPVVKACASHGVGGRVAPEDIADLQRVLERIEASRPE